MIVFDRRGIRLVHGDCRSVDPPDGHVTVTDPPYGYSYKSGMAAPIARSIEGDDREWWEVTLTGSPAAVFGVWHKPPPEKPRAVLVLDKGPAAGMGDLSIPWKPNHELIWIFGSGWHGRRTSGVLRGITPTWSSGAAKRLHPTEKPQVVLREIINKAPLGPIWDPFAGSGASLIAAMHLGREAVGVEIDAQWIPAAVERLERLADAMDAQQSLFPRDAA